MENQHCDQILAISKRANLTYQFMVASFSIYLPCVLVLIAKAIRLRRALIYEKMGATKKVI